MESKRNNIFAISVFHILGFFEEELTLDQIRLKVDNLMISKNDMLSFYSDIMMFIPSLNIEFLIGLLNKREIYTSFSLSYNPFIEKKDSDKCNLYQILGISIYAEDFTEIIEATVLIWLNSWLFVYYKKGGLNYCQDDRLSPRSSPILFNSIIELLFSLQSGVLLADLARDVIEHLYPNSELLNNLGLSFNAVSPSICIQNLTLVFNAIKKYLSNDISSTHLWEPERIFLLDRKYTIGLLYDLLRCFENLPPKASFFNLNKKQPQELNFIYWYYENVCASSKVALEDQILLLEERDRTAYINENELERIKIIENFSLEKVSITKSDPLPSFNKELCNSFTGDNLSFVNMRNSTFREDIYPSFQFGKDSLISPIGKMPSEFTRKLDYDDLISEHLNLDPIKYKQLNY